MTRPEFVSAAVAELMRAAAPFAALPVPEEAPDDGYQAVGGGCVRIYFREVRRIRAAIEAVRAEWRGDGALGVGVQERLPADDLSRVLGLGDPDRGAAERVQPRAAGVRRDGSPLGRGGDRRWDGRSRREQDRRQVAADRGRQRIEERREAERRAADLIRAGQRRDDIVRQLVADGNAYTMSCLAYASARRMPP